MLFVRIFMNDYEGAGFLLSLRLNSLLLSEELKQGRYYPELKSISKEHQKEKDPEDRY